MTQLDATLGDYVIFRRDGLLAEHLAGVVDDSEQGGTTVVRGVDLLDSTAAHLHLQSMLGVAAPSYLHLPVLVDAGGPQLSKQTGATPIDTAALSRTAVRVLGYLCLIVPSDLLGAPPATLWSWAVSNWQIDRLKGHTQLQVERH